jgi:hypothetical protein
VTKQFFTFAKEVSFICFYFSLILLNFWPFTAYLQWSTL